MDMPKNCFVIQGFGKKQDYEQGKLFDLDASYDVIKEAVQGAGLECHRADELLTSKIIDQVMYDQLLDADLVVADITTLNFNAAFELGVRYALRPYATIVVGEEGMNFPFDINHICIHTYKHLGEDIGFKEAKRFQEALKELAEKVVEQEEVDSPVYKFLPQLPSKGYVEVTKKTKAEQVQRSAHAESAPLRYLTDKAKSAMRNEKFASAADYWMQARSISGKDDYIVQQLALSTYKSKQPDEETALNKAKSILGYLKPHGSFDPETLGLWAAVHKRLFEINEYHENLREAVFALERGFFIKKDYYNGINLAYMMDVKASKSQEPEKGELHCMARYIRRKVKQICKQAIADEHVRDNEEFWILATLYEACVGTGENDEAAKWYAEAEKASKESWMKGSMDKQVQKLRALLNLT
ncbi:tetratricopeptide repeat-containing protein [Desulfobacter curvatus]|uniref:tetratricopeptide repeat-containing protein n=1 Tax=Desulfobacter curvatus TaxID=2290 RepID=UPI0004776051|nr:tetratricopeptide repeat-containing protein [Desulfobacter curvatus]